MTRWLTDGRAPGHEGVVRLVVAAMLVAAGLLGPSVASATPARTEAVHLHYAAPTGCPSEGEMISYAVSLGGAFRPAQPGELARGFDVVIEPAGGEYSGSLVVRDLAGGERQRTVTCGRCESVARALALFVALALQEQPDEPADAAEAPAPEHAPDPADAFPHDALRARDDAAGVMLSALWNRFQLGPGGAALTLVSRPLGGPHLGATLAYTSDVVADEVLGVGANVARGFSVRAGLVAAWGAPWSEDVVGFALEAGVITGVERGAFWPGAQSTQQAGECTPEFYEYDGLFTCKLTRWRYASPYAAGTLLFQAWPRALFRPVVGLTGLWSANYRGVSAGQATFDIGLAARW